MKKHWPPDPLLDEVDEARRRILAEQGNDPRRVLQFYMEYQEQFADRLIRADEEQARRGRPAA